MGRVECEVHAKGVGGDWVGRGDGCACLAVDFN